MATAPCCMHLLADGLTIAVHPSYVLHAISRKLRVFQALCGSSFLLFASPGTGGPIGGLTEKKELIMPTGTVKFFNEQKGYGFIAPEGGGEDAFVHISAVERAGMTTLQKEQRVSYELERDQRGKTSAVNIQSA